jgi:hypothetical protein
MALAIDELTGHDPPLPFLLDATLGDRPAPTSHWSLAARFVRAASDLIAVHHDPNGRPRSRGRPVHPLVAYASSSALARSSSSLRANALPLDSS